MEQRPFEERKKQGDEGESKARLLLKQQGYKIFEIDWIAEKEGKYIQVEVKHKDVFKAGSNMPVPFDGHGMEIWKITKRLEFETRTGIAAYFLIFDTNGKIYGQYLKILEWCEPRYFDTKNGLRIYPLSAFELISR